MLATIDKSLLSSRLLYNNENEICGSQAVFVFWVARPRGLASGHHRYRNILLPSSGNVVLYGYETYYLTLTEEQRVRVIHNILT
jgi:hypothetical protein